MTQKSTVMPTFSFLGFLEETMAINLTTQSINPLIFLLKKRKALGISTDTLFAYIVMLVKFGN